MSILMIGFKKNNQMRRSQWCKYFHLKMD